MSLSLSPPVSLLLPPPELLPVAARVELPPLAACSALRLLLLSEKKRRLQATFLRWPLRIPNGTGRGGTGGPCCCGGLRVPRCHRGEGEEEPGARRRVEQSLALALN